MVQMYYYQIEKMNFMHFLPFEDILKMSLMNKSIGKFAIKEFTKKIKTELTKMNKKIEGDFKTDFVLKSLTLKALEIMNEKGYMTIFIKKKDIPQSFFWGVLTGGFHAGINRKYKLVEFNYDISNFDEVIIGSPIWNGKLACPINTVLANVNLEGKKLTFVLYSGSGEAPKAVKKLKEKYACEVIELQEPKKYPDNLSKLSN